MALSKLEARSGGEIMLVRDGMVPTRRYAASGFLSSLRVCAGLPGASLAAMRLEEALSFSKLAALAKKNWRTRRDSNS